MKEDPKSYNPLHFSCILKLSCGWSGKLTLNNLDPRIGYVPTLYLLLCSAVSAPQSHNNIANNTYTSSIHNGIHINYDIHIHHKITLIHII